MDEAAAAKVIGVETAKRAKQQRINAAERTATAVAEAELDDAAEKRSEAAAKRAHANRVDDLADGREGGAESGARHERQGLARHHVAKRLAALQPSDVGGDVVGAAGERVAA